MKATSKIHFGPNDVPFGERNDYKVALPEYEVKYDSAQIRSIAKLGSFDKTKRELKLGAVCYYNDSAEEGAAASPTRKSPHRQQHQESDGEVPHKSVYEMRRSAVQLPKIKTRSPEKLIFNASSYRPAAGRDVLSLTPKRINRVANVHLFDPIVAIPRKHVSVGFTSGSTHGFST